MAELRFETALAARSLAPGGFDETLYDISIGLPSRGGPAEPSVSRALAPVLNRAATLPDPGAPQWPRSRPARLAVVGDASTAGVFEGACPVDVLTPDGPPPDLAGTTVVVLAPGTARDRRARPAIAHQAWALDHVVPLARRAQIPIALIDVDGVGPHTSWAPLVAVVDVVLSACEIAASRFRDVVGSSVPVAVLPRGVNPRRHHPVGAASRSDGVVVFAGGWRRDRDLDRHRHGSRIFEGVQRSGHQLAVVDTGDQSARSIHRFPEHVLARVVDTSLSAQGDDRTVGGRDWLASLDRATTVGVALPQAGVGSAAVEQRVLDLLASGTAVFAGYSAPVASGYPVVCTAGTVEDTRRELDQLHADDVEWRRRRDLGIRTAYATATSDDVVTAVLAAVGVSRQTPRLRVTVLDAAEHLRENEALIGPGVEVTHWSSADVSRAPLQHDVLVRLPETADQGLLADLVNGFRYSDAEFVTAPERIAQEHAPTTEGRARATAAWRGTSASAALVAGDPIRGRGLTVGHRDTPEAIVRVDRAAPTLSVIVPLFDNGRALRNTCLTSLLRSSLVDEMEILVVDDGSSDLETVDLLDSLDSAWPQVRLLRLPQGGSGSASRPRNHGLAAARGAFVTYLDPDNEAVDDGYAQLVAALRKSSAPIAVGDMVKYSDRRRLIPHVARLRPHLDAIDDVTSTVPPGLLAATAFAPVSVQAMVARTAWLRDAALLQPEGAIGEDSFLSQQILHRASEIALVSTVVHVYYASIAGSTVNTVTPRYFRRYLPLERARISWLAEHGLLEAYREQRLERFVRLSYVDRLALVHPDELPACLELVRSLIALHGAVEFTDPVVVAVLATDRDDASVLPHPTTGGSP